LLAVSRIHVAIDHATPLVAAGLAAMLERQPEFALTRSAASQVLVADHETALDTAAAPARAAHAPPRILVVADTSHGWRIKQALERGVRGYIALGCSAAELISAVRGVCRGERYLCRSASAAIAESLAQEALTRREMDVLQLVSVGLDNKSVAARLGISVGTVKSHVKALLDKLGVASRTQAAAAAHQRGLVDTASETAPKAYRAGALASLQLAPR